MNIQIDTEKKIITLLGFVNLDQFFKELDILIPSDDWKKYQLNYLYYPYPYFDSTPKWIPPVFPDPPFKVTC